MGVLPTRAVEAPVSRGQRQILKHSQLSTGVSRSTVPSEGFVECKNTNLLCIAGEGKN